jgi:hypothetical protein
MEQGVLLVLLVLIRCRPVLHHVQIARKTHILQWLVPILPILAQTVVSTVPAQMEVLKLKDVGAMPVTLGIMEVRVVHVEQAHINQRRGRRRAKIVMKVRFQHLQLQQVLLLVRHAQLTRHPIPELVQKRTVVATMGFGIRINNIHNNLVDI